MPDSYWFASILIDRDGHWRGRFLRSIPPAGHFDPPIAALLGGIATAVAADSLGDLVFLPSAVHSGSPAATVIPWADAAAGDSTPCLWLGDDRTRQALPASRYLAYSVARSPAPAAAGRTHIVLDTGVDTGWQFGPPAGDRETLADIGHVHHRRPAGGTATPRLMDLLALSARDAETRDLEQAFRADPQLAADLLRVVNSVGMRVTHPLAGLEQAIAAGGRRQLQRWLQLLIYVSAGPERPLPLLQLAAYRGRLLELLASPGHDPDSAYIAGVYSLLDRRLAYDMTEILADLPLPPTVREALRARGGFLGVALAACEAAEAGRLDAAAATLCELPIDARKWLHCQHTAYGWALALGRALSPAPAS